MDVDIDAIKARIRPATDEELSRLVEVAGRYSLSLDAKKRWRAYLPKEVIDMSKRGEVLNKLAERCLAELDMVAPNTELLNLYLQHSRPEAAAATTASYAGLSTVGFTDGMNDLLANPGER